MKRKALLLSVGVAFLLVALVVSVTSFAGTTGKGTLAPRLSAPGVPADGPFSSTQPTGTLEADLAALDAQLATSPLKPPAIDPNNLPETIQKAVALQNSLTADQLARVRAALDKYLPEMKGIGDTLLGAGKPSTSGPPSGASQEVRTRLSALARSIDAEMAQILTADQYALYQAVVRPSITVEDAGVVQPPISSPNIYYPYCWYAGLYGAGSDLYAYYAYLYAYYGYYYYGGSYAYYGYVYAYYAYYYIDLAATLLGGAYFNAYLWGSDWNGSGYYGYLYAYYGYYYSYLAYLNEYYAYVYAGNPYAYYGYLYSYYAYPYAYYAYYYGYYYCW